MSRSIVQWFFATLVLALSASADPCDDARPWHYDMTFTCEAADGVCSMASGVSVSLVDFSGSPKGCATVGWDFGDGSPVVTANGADVIQHTYSAAGEYTITASISTPTPTFLFQRSDELVVANGLLRWSDRETVEGQTVQFTVTRTNVTGAVSVPWSVQNPGGPAPAGVAPAAGTLTFAPGQAVGTISLATANDSLFTGDRNYELVAGVVSNDFLLDRPAVSLHIEDDDFSLIKFAQRPFRVSENAGVAVVTLTRTGDLTARVSTDFSVDTFFSSDTRIVETFGELVFEPGQASRSFNVAIVDDDEWTGSASARIRLGGTTGGARLETSETQLIVDDDDEGGQVITADQTVFIEGDAGFKSAVVQFTSTHPTFASFDVAVTDVTATRGVDYFLQSSTVFFSGGTTATFVLGIRGDAIPEADETLTLALTQRFGTSVPPPAPVTVTIQNDDTRFTPEQFRIRRGHTQQATLVVGGTSGTALVVPLTSSRPELLRVPASVTIPAGANRVTFEMEGLEVGTTIRVTATLPPERGGVQKIVGHVYESQGVTFDPGSVHAYPGQEVPVKIAIDGGSGKMFDLPLDVRDAQVASAPAAVTILEDGTGSFTVKALQAGTTRITVKKPGSVNDYARLEIVVSEAPETPAIASISPATGPAAGGTAFVAPGSHLTADCTLSFGGVPAATILGADGMLHGLTPPHVPGTVDAVLTCGATTFVLADAFTYLPSPPSLAAVSPTFGSTVGGTLVRATGTNFQSGCWMFFDGVAATAVEFESTTSMIASVPSRAAAGLVATSIRCGSDEATLPASYAYSSAAESAASIISVDPLVGAPGESVTITGSRLRADDAVDFDGVPATILRTRPDQHVVRIPELPLGMSSLTLTDAGGRVNTTGPIFTIVEPVPPQVTSVTPANALPGSEVTLHGRGFRPGYTFAVGGQPAQTLSLRFGEVTIRLADTVAAGAHPVHVLNASGKVAAIGSSVQVGGGALRVRGIVPGCGFTEGGASVLIDGEGFGPGATVTFNGIPATNVVVVDAGQLRVTTPPNVTGPATVTVKNANGDSATATRFTYFSPFQPGACAPDTRSRSVRH